MIMNQNAYYKTEDGSPTVRLNIPFSDKSRTGGSNRHATKKQETLDGLTKAIFRNKKKLTPNRIFTTHRYITQNITLEDTAGCKIKLPSGYFDYSVFNTPSFIFGRIITRKDYEAGSFQGKSSIKIEYLDIYNRQKTISALVSTKILEEEAAVLNLEDITDEKTWITGIAYRKKYIFNRMGRYDKYTHSSYGSLSEERTKTCVYNFVLHQFE